MGPGSHGSTFGGNPVVCAGANVVVDRMDQSFLANVSERAVQLRAGLAKLPMVKNLSGIGLMVGIEFFGGIQALFRSRQREFKWISDVELYRSHSRKQTDRFSRCNSGYESKQWQCKF